MKFTIILVKWSLLLYFKMASFLCTIPEEILQAIFLEDLGLPSCVRERKCGMDTLGILMFGRKFPLLLYLLRPSSIISSPSFDTRFLRGRIQHAHSWKSYQ